MRTLQYSVFIILCTISLNATAQYKQGSIPENIKHFVILLSKQKGSSLNNLGKNMPAKLFKIGYKGPFEVVDDKDLDNQRL
jgi:hypothetical protein